MGFGGGKERSRRRGRSHSLPFVAVLLASGLFMSIETAPSRIRFVLVGTQHPGNMGAAARAMKTMGLGRLVLVAPEKPLNEEAFRRSAGAAALTPPRLAILSS